VAFDQQSDDNISQINITPLVDVMLVLLVIFMVTAPILQHGVGVDLPQVTAGPLEGKNEQLVIVVAKDGRIRFKEQVLSVDELGQKLSAMIQERPEQAVYLRADKNVSYGKVVEVMAAVRNAGVRKLGMVTEPVREE
jgi:biopolymer transport protein TolR